MSNPPVLRLGGNGPVRNAPSLVATRPDMTLLAQLADMGFSVAQASQALIQTNNNIAAALDWLDQNSSWEIPADVINQSLMEVQPGYGSNPGGPADIFVDSEHRQTLGTSIASHERTTAKPVSDALAVATLQAAEPTGEIHSRYESNSKDAYRERVRQKEIEKARLEKLKQQEEAARLKAEVAQERARRAGVPTTSSSAMEVIEESAQKSEAMAFEERKRQKEAEEERKKKAAAAADKERILKEIAEEKERKFGGASADADASAPKLTIAEQKAAYDAKQKEKAKEAWKAEQEANQRRLAELRRQLQEDKERKAALRALAASSSPSSSAAPTTTSTAKMSGISAPAPQPASISPTTTSSVSPTPTDPNAPAKSVAEQMAEARRARLGITKVTGRQAHAGNASFDDDDDTTDVDKIKARNKAKAAAEAAAASSGQSSPSPASSPAPAAEPTMHESLRDMHQKKFEAQRKKEEEEAERRARAERASRMIANTASLAASVQPVAAPSAVHEPEEEIRLETSHPEIPEEPTFISLRLPDGRIKKAAFKASDPVSAVHKYAASWLPLDSIFSLLIPMPRREFTAESAAQVSLREAGLTPRGTLTVLTLQNRGTVTQAPPRPAHLGRIMHMMNYEGNEMEATEEYANMSYEEMLELQERMGSVPTGLNNREILALPSAPYVPSEDGAFCVVCQVDIEEGEVVTTLPNCKHVFHKDHIETWLKDHRSCPACRQRVILGRINPAPGAQDDHEGHNHDEEYASGSADEED